MTARIRPFLLPAAWALVVGVLTLPAAFTVPEAGLDPSWLAGLNMAFERHLHFGTGVVWTYGPYGFTDFNAFYYTNTWTIGLLVTLLAHAAFFVTVAAFINSVGGSRWRWALMAAPFTLPLTESPGAPFPLSVTQFPTVEYECALAAMLLLFSSGVARQFRNGVVLAVAAGAALGLLVTIKGTGVAAAAALLVGYGAFVLFTRRPILLASVVASVTLSFLTLWTLAGQPLSGIVPYIRGSYEMISGYTAAMSLLADAPLPVRHVTAQVAFAALAVISSVASLLWALLRRDRQLACLLLLATPLLFLDFKEGYVRFGNRQIVFYSLAVLVETLVLLRALRPGSGRWPAFGWAQSGAVAIVSAALVGGLAAATGSMPSQAPWPITTLGPRLATYPDAAALIGSSERRARLTDETVANIRRSYGLSAGSSAAEQTTDILPWAVEIAYGYPLRWNPRPVLQSYQAYTPYLDQLDAAHLEGPNAPSRLLVAYGSIDGRYPPYDEPALFRAIVAGYQVIGFDRDFLVLARRPQPASTHLQPMSSVQSRLGDEVRVPSAPNGGTVYAGVTVPYSLKGQVMNLAFQPSELHLRFRLDGGAAGPFRFVPRVAPDGLMVGSYIGSLDDYGRFLDQTLDQPIRTLQITADRPSDYTGLVSITFYSSP